MKKTSVYLSEAEESRLEQLSRAEGRPKAEIIREAISSYVPRRVGDREFAMAGSGESKDGRSVADIPEEELLEGFGE